jgi:hypothetical protein
MKKKLSNNPCIALEKLKYSSQKVTGNDLDDQGLNCSRGRKLSLPQDIQTDSEIHSHFYLMGCDDSFLGSKEVGT